MIFCSIYLAVTSSASSVLAYPGASLSHTVSTNLMGVEPSPRVRTLNVETRTSASIMVTKLED